MNGIQKKYISYVLITVANASNFGNAVISHFTPNTALAYCEMIGLNNVDMASKCPKNHNTVFENQITLCSPIQILIYIT